MMMHDQLTSHLLRLADAYGTYGGLKRSTVFKNVCRDPRLCSRLEAGENFKVRTWDDAVQRFSDAWPAALPWPKDIMRPPPRLMRGPDLAA